MSFKIKDVILGLEDTIKALNTYDDIELGRPLEPTLYGDNKIFIWVDSIPSKKEELGGEISTAEISAEIIPIVAGTDRNAVLTIADNIDDLFDTLDESNLGLRGCQVDLPDRNLLRIAPTTLGTGTETRKPTLCMGAVINLTIRKTGGT